MAANQHYRRSIVIRRATPADAPAACAALHRSITVCCVEDHHNDPEILAQWLRNKTPETVRRWFSSPSDYSVVAILGGDVAGVGMMSNTGEVMLCYLAPDGRFTGAGKEMLCSLEAHGRTLGLVELRLNSTATAREFYLRNGFEECAPPEVKQGVISFPMKKSLD